MAFALKPKQPIRRRLKHVVQRQLEHGEESLRADRASAVFEARKSVKKARAVVALLETADTGSMGKDARRLRAVAHTLAALRDADAAIATFDALRKRFPKRLPMQTYALVRKQLVLAKTRALNDARGHGKLARAARSLHTVLESAKDWRVPALDERELPKLLKASYRANRNAMRDASKKTSPTALHTWRKRLKTFWYHLRLVEELTPGVRSKVRRIKQLETWLGEDHNLSVLQTMLAKDDELARRVPGAVREVGEMTAALQARLRKKEFALGKRLMTERPKAFARHLLKRQDGDGSR